MASSGCRRRADRIALAAALIAVAGGCATRTPAPASGEAVSPAGGQPQIEPPPVMAPALQTGIDPGVELPAGAGREILVGACLGCHDLGGLALFKGFYTRDSWRDLVLTMQANGATVTARDVEIVTDYLATYFGPESR